MNKGVWEGNNLIINPKILILGESHYEDENYGKEVSFSTSSVLNYYFDHRERWSQFFDKIAASFGYSQDKSREFFEHVYFGNYVDVLCGIGNDAAEKYINKNRIRYNSELFDYINLKEIDIIICFSKLVYNNLPSLSNLTKEEHEEQVVVGKIGRNNNYVSICNYIPNISHPNCQTVLKKQLTVYGLRHPSNQGGFAANQIYEFFKTQSCLNKLIYEKSSTDSFIEVISAQDVDVISSTHNDINSRYLNENRGNSYPITPEVDSQFILRVITPMACTLIVFLFAIVTQQYIVILFDLIPFILTITGFKAAKNRCPNCHAWNPWIISRQKLLKEDKVRVRRPLGAVYFHSSGRATYGLRQTFVSADEKTYENELKCKYCGYETKSYFTNIDDKIR